MTTNVYMMGYYYRVSVNREGRGGKGGHLVKILF